MSYLPTTIVLFFYVFKFLIAAFYKRLIWVIKFCFHVFHEKKEKRTTSSVEKILDAIVLAKNVMPYVLLLQQNALLYILMVLYLSVY